MNDQLIRRARFLAVPAYLLLAGCVATQRDVLDLEGQMDTLQAEIVKLRQTLEGVQSNQAELIQKMDTVHGDLSGFGESLSMFRENVSALGTRMDDLGAQMEANTKVLGEAAQAAKRTPSDIFKEADAQLSRKEYDLAVQGFELYLKDFPKGSLADQANYNIAEARFQQERWLDAARAYAAVLEGFPTSPLTAATRLRYAVSVIRVDAQKNRQEAERYLESVVHDFPSSPEAKKAAQYLDELRPKKKTAEGGKAAPSKPAPKAAGSSGPKPAGKTP